MSTSPSENPVFTFARVDPETLEVTLKYNTNGGAKWAEGDLECTIPFEVLADHAVLADDGSITLQADPEKVTQKTAQAWTALRTERNARLAASDYTQLQDAHLSVDKKDAWAAYRQALRDLPDETINPLEAAWPLKPGELPPVVPVASSRFGALLEEAGVEPVVEVPEVPEVQEVVEPVPEVPVVPEPVVESEPVVEVPVVPEPVPEVPVVPEPVVESEPVVEVPEPVQASEPVPEVPVVPEPVVESEPVVEVPEVQASEPAPVEAEPVV